MIIYIMNRAARAGNILLTILIASLLGAGCKKSIDEPFTTTVASNDVVGTTPYTPYKLYFNSVAQLSLPRAGIVAGAAGNKILFAGGYLPIDGDVDAILTPVSRVDIFDATTLQRTTYQLGQARWGMGAAALGNKIFFAGGYTANSHYSKRVDIYDASSNTWTTATLSQARAGIAVAATGSKVIFAGGFNSQISNVIDIYDVNSGVWTTSTFSNIRSVRATATKGDIAIVGSNVRSPAPKAHIYHTATNSWTDINLTYYGNTEYNYAPRMFAVSAGSKMLFGFGGHSPISGAVNVVQSVINTNNPTFLSNPRAEVGVCTSGNFAFIAGGTFFSTYYNQNLSNIINVYNGALNAWTLSTLHTPANKIQAGSANSTVMFAGINTNEFGYHDVQIYKLAAQAPLTPAR